MLICITSAEEDMSSVFWGARGILLIDYLEKEKNIIGGEDYATFLNRLEAAIGEKCPGTTKTDFVLP